MILLTIPASAFLLWAACGFTGLPVKTRKTAQVTFSLFLVVALSSTFIARMALS